MNVLTLNLVTFWISETGVQSLTNNSLAVIVESDDWLYKKSACCQSAKLLIDLFGSILVYQPI